jgi:hypothetical protein
MQNSHQPACLPGWRFQQGSRSCHRPICSQQASRSASSHTISSHTISSHTPGAPEPVGGCYSKPVATWGACCAGLLHGGRCDFSSCMGAAGHGRGCGSLSCSSTLLAAVPACWKTPEVEVSCGRKGRGGVLLSLRESHGPSAPNTCNSSHLAADGPQQSLHCQAGRFVQSRQYIAAGIPARLASFKAGDT